MTKKDKAESYLEHLNDRGFQIIQLTEYKTKSYGNIKRKSLNVPSKNIHDVIGREYENVAVIIDNHLIHDASSAELSSLYSEHYPYNEGHSYLEAFTRVKNKLVVVIINNLPIYKLALEILSWWKDSNNELEKRNKELEKKISELSKINQELTYRNNFLEEERQKYYSN